MPAVAAAVGVAVVDDDAVEGNDLLMGIANCYSMYSNIAVAAVVPLYLYDCDYFSNYANCVQNVSLPNLLMLIEML